MIIISFDGSKTRYKTTLLSTVGKPQYNKTRSETDFKNARRFP